MLSGIGPADYLSSLGIPVVLDAPEVGRNLQNHPSYACTECSLITVDQSFRRLSLGCTECNSRMRAIDWDQRFVSRKRRL